MKKLLSLPIPAFSASSVFFLGVLTGLVVAPPSRADVVRLQSGEEVRGEVRKQTAKEVVLALSSGGGRSIARRDIAPGGVLLENEPRELREADEARRQREFDKAHRGFRTVIQLIEAASGAAEPKNGKKDGKAAAKKAQRQAAAATLRPVFLQHALYGEVETYRDEGKAQEALAAIKELLEKDQETWYLSEVLLLKVQLLVSQDSAGLAEAVDDARKRAAALGVGAEVSDRITLIRADHLSSQKKDTEAQKLYKELEKSTNRPVSEAARLALAQMQLEAGEMVSAKLAFSTLLRESRTRSVLCGASRGLGDAQLKEMGQSQNLDGLREALEHYLRASVRYFPVDDEPAEAHQEALLSGARCAEQILSLTKGDERKQSGYRTVARDLYLDVQRTYPRTPAARKAQEALRNLGRS